MWLFVAGSQPIYTFFMLWNLFQKCRMRGWIVAMASETSADKGDLRVFYLRAKFLEDLKSMRENSTATEYGGVSTRGLRERAPCAQQSTSTPPSNFVGVLVRMPAPWTERTLPHGA